MKPFFRKLHIWLSLPFGIIFSVICLTGAILVFEREFTQMVSPEMIQLQKDRQEQKSIDKSNGRGGNNLKGRGVYGERSVHDEIHGQKANLEKQQQKSRPPRLPFFQEVRKLHRWLLNPPAKKGENSLGKTVVGISTIMMVMVLVSGIAIWIPKNRRQLMLRLKVSVNKGWQRFLYDSHVSIGIYVSILLLVMALTGLTWSFGWYRDFAYGLFADVLEPSELRRFFFSLHTGSWGGVFSKILYFLSALVGAVLSWTGYCLWFKKTYSCR